MVRSPIGSISLCWTVFSGFTYLAPPSSNSFTMRMALSAIISSPGSSNSKIPDCLVNSLSKIKPVNNFEAKVMHPSVKLKLKHKTLWSQKWPSDLGCTAVISHAALFVSPAPVSSRFKQIQIQGTQAKHEELIYTLQITPGIWPNVLCLYSVNSNPSCIGPVHNPWCRGVN